MKHVYVIKFENTVAFTTARKVIEFAKENFTGWNPYLDGQSDIDINAFKTDRLISELNRVGFIQLYDGIYMTEIEKLSVN